MFTEISGEVFPLDNIIAEEELRLVFSDTPVEDVDRVALCLPESLCVKQESGAELWFYGFTRAVRIEKNLSNEQVLLVVRKEE